MEPGLTAFTRMQRSFKSVVHVRANERTDTASDLSRDACCNELLIGHLGDHRKRNCADCFQLSKGLFTHAL